MLSHRLPGRPRALPRVALLAPVHSVSRWRGCGMARVERLSRTVPGGVGLALLEIVSAKQIRPEPKLAGGGAGIFYSELVGARRVEPALRGALGCARNGGCPVFVGIPLESAGRLAISHCAPDPDRVGDRCLWRFISGGLV